MSSKTGIHIWSLQKKLQEFLNAKNGAKFSSGEFPVGDFNWQIVAYPNGNRFENYGSVMIYLKLLGYPSELPYGGLIVVNFRIQCEETCSSSTFIETYTRVNDSKGWSARALLLSDLSKETINKITFKVDVKILKIVNHNQRITYESPLKIVKNKFNLKWSVPAEMVNRFEFANNGKWFESGNYSHLWCFKVAPNGYNDENAGACLVFIQLCGLPPNISKMKCKVKLFHVESSSRWSVKKEFSYEKKNAGWTKGKLSYAKLMKHETITFRAEIEILDLFDVRGAKFPIGNLSNTNYKYQAKATYDDSVIGTSNATRLGGKSKRAQTTAGGASPYNPYGGYGSHNFEEYFSSAYKQTESYKTATTPVPDDEKDAKEESSTESEEEDEHGGDNASDEQESSDDGLELDTIEDIEEHVAFLKREYKKLNKIVASLKSKTKGNNTLIRRLQNDIQMLKKGSAQRNTGSDLLNNTPNEKPTKIETNALDIGTTKKPNVSFAGWAKF